jgi:hypothetical protein
LVQEFTKSVDAEARIERGYHPEPESTTAQRAACFVDR